MRIGDVLLFKGRHIYSRMIQIATRSPYSHAACYIGDGYIVESDWGGVHIVDLLNKYKNTETDVYRHILQGYEENYMKKVVNWMCHKSGLGYDYGGLVGIAL